MESKSDMFCDGYTKGTITLGHEFTTNKLEDFSLIFYNNGWVHLGNILNSLEINSLIEILNSRIHDKRVILDEECDYTRGVSSMRMFEYNKAFLDLLTRQPIIGFVEEILGNDCHLIAQNALFTRIGEGIIKWHIDDHLFFPFDLHEYEKIPCYSLNVMIPLTDIEEINHGPTQVIQRSHVSGKIPPKGAINPTYNNK